MVTVFWGGNRCPGKSLFYSFASAHSVAFKRKLSVVAQRIKHKTERIKVCGKISRLVVRDFRCGIVIIIGIVLKIAEAAELEFIVGCNINIIGIDVAVKDLVFFKLFKRFSDLNTKIHDFAIVWL